MKPLKISETRLVSGALNYPYDGTTEYYGKPYGVRFFSGSKSFFVAGLTDSCIAANTYPEEIGNLDHVNTDQCNDRDLILINIGFSQSVLRNLR